MLVLGHQVAASYPRCDGIDVNRSARCLQWRDAQALVLRLAAARAQTQVRALAAALQ